MNLTSEPRFLNMIMPMTVMNQGYRISEFITVVRKPEETFKQGCKQFKFIL